MMIQTPGNLRHSDADSIKHGFHHLGGLEDGEDPATGKNVREYATFWVSMKGIASEQSLSVWTSWCNRLWEKAETAWIDRVGQDHFYRERVVVPSLITSITSLKPPARTLIDIGCGDAYVTEKLFETPRLQRSAIHDILLVDRSRSELAAAKKRKCLSGARFHEADLLEGDSLGSVATMPSPKVILAIFVLQELPCLESLLHDLYQTMHADDLCLAVFPAPSYATRLFRTGLMRRVSLAVPQKRDWSWAGEYPISVNSHIIYLPYFHRTVKMLRQLLARAGFGIVDCRFLTVLDSPEATMVFRESVYGEGIVGVHSSVLMEIRK
jgi:trans-aconitate methyltransferase